MLAFLAYLNIKCFFQLGKWLQNLLNLKGVFPHLSSLNPSSPHVLEIYKHGEPLLFFLTFFSFSERNIFLNFLSFLFLFFPLPPYLTLSWFDSSFIAGSFYSGWFISICCDLHFLLFFSCRTLETAVSHRDFPPVSPVTLPFHLHARHLFILASLLPSLLPSCNLSFFLPPSLFALLLFLHLSLFSLSSDLSAAPHLFLFLFLPPPRDSAELARGRGWSRRTWAACCRCVTSGWTPACCTRCPCWRSARTSWWCGSSSAWHISSPNSAAAERTLCLEWLYEEGLQRVFLKLCHSPVSVCVTHAHWYCPTLSHPDEGLYTTDAPFINGKTTLFIPVLFCFWTLPAFIF